MAGIDPQLHTMGYGQPTLTQAPTVGAGGSVSSRLASAVQPHHGLIGLVLVAVLVIVVLDRAGFRFAVTVGRG